MCLTLTKDSSRLKRNFRRRKGPIIAYKVLNLIHNNYFSPIWSGSNWEFNKIRESNRDSTNLFPCSELSKKKVYQGYHLFLKKGNLSKSICGSSTCPFSDGPSNDKVALCSKTCQRVTPKYRTIEVEVDPKDIVAIGDYYENNSDNLSMVVTKCKPIRVVD